MPVTLAYERPWLAPYQKAALFGPERYAIVEATTKAGKTVGCMIWLAEKAMAGKAGQNFWWVAPIFPQAEIVFGRLKRALPREIYTANESKRTITLANGAVIWFKGAEKPDSLFGEDVHAAVMDEATRCKEDSWFALRTTLTATEGPVRLIGNVKGRRNWAYQMARRAESGTIAMTYAKITAVDAVKAGIITAAEIADAKAIMPDAVFRELYMAEPSDDTGNPFGVKAIQACIKGKGLSKKKAVGYGVDLAKSIDWTVLAGLDEDGALCKFDRWQGPWEQTIQRILGHVGTVNTLVDSTGVGDPVLESLQKQGRTQGATFMGYHFSSASKQKLMEGLSVAIQQGNVSYPGTAEGADVEAARPLISELESFEYVYTRTGVQYSAPEGLFDDCVCAFALAVQLVASGPQPISYRELSWG